MSIVHWTPIEAALRAVDLLAPAAGEIMLDVGSGVGKLCVVGALRSDASWWGLELRTSLLKAAEAAARALGVSDRTCFLKTDALTYDWAAADGVYLYNPFGELLLSPDASSLSAVGPLRGGPSRAVRSARYRRLVSAIEEHAWRLRLGARVVTFHGFGGVWPRCLELVERAPMGASFLELWVRVGAVRRLPTVRGAALAPDQASDT